MNLEDVGQHEALPAVVADVGPLAVVGLPVDSDVPGRRESLLADLAGVPLLASVGGLGTGRGVGGLSVWAHHS